MCGRLISTLLGVVVFLSACTQGDHPDAGAGRASLSSPIAPSHEPDSDSGQTRPKQGPSPIPLTTADVPDPRAVSLFRFAPADARILVARPISEIGGAPAQLVLTWERGRDESVPKELGLLL